MFGHGHHGRGRFGPGGPHHGGGGWHGRRRGGRVFEQGDLRLVILKLIAEKPRHGYEIIKAIEDALGGAYSPSPGVVYPTLSMLDDQGFASVQAEDSGKKLYAATEAGLKHLEDNKPAVDAAFSRAEGASGDRLGGMRIRRAMENLRTALRLRMSQGSLGEAEIDKIAAALDAAAASIERA
ncbi:MAG: PadR family transcriptional regulator [Caulobacterales bacterium]